MTTELDVKVDNKVKAIQKEPSNYTVILLNDEVTPMDFVIELIVKIFRHTPETAKDLTLKIHKEGSAVVGIYTYEIAEQKGIEATNESRTRGFPLQVKIEQEQFKRTYQTSTPRRRTTRVRRRTNVWQDVRRNVCNVLMEPTRNIQFVRSLCNGKQFIQ